MKNKIQVLGKYIYTQPFTNFLLPLFHYAERGNIPTTQERYTTKEHLVFRNTVFIREVWFRKKNLTFRFDFRLFNGVKLKKNLENYFLLGFLIIYDFIFFCFDSRYCIEEEGDTVFNHAQKSRILDLFVMLKRIQKGFLGSRAIWI